MRPSVSVTRKASCGGRGTGLFLFTPGEAGTAAGTVIFKNEMTLFKAAAVSRTLDWMNRITMFLPSTSDACSSAVSPGGALERVADGTKKTTLV